MAYLYRGETFLELGDQEASERDLGLYEDGFNEGYEAFRRGEEIDYKASETWICYKPGVVPADYGGQPTLSGWPVREKDLWYALGVIRGYEQAQEDAK